MATLRAVIIDSDGTHRVTDIENSLGGFRAAIGGGYIEGVFGGVATIYVEEEGLIKSLPYNPVATEFANNVLGSGAFLCGTALIVGPGDGEGNDTDVRQTVVDYFMKEN